MRGAVLHAPGDARVEDRRAEGVSKIKARTDGLGAHSVIEAVGTQESMMQAIEAARPGGHVGYVGVSHDVELAGDALFGSGLGHCQDHPTIVTTTPTANERSIA